MSLRNLNWIPICCAWPEYAEANTRDGGRARLYRDQANQPGVIRVCRFDAANKPIDADGDGVPDYVEMPEAESEALLA